MGKMALVTGSSRGIGKSVCNALREIEWGFFTPGRDVADWSWSSESRDRSSPIYLARQYSEQNIKFDAIVFCHGNWFMNGHQSARDWRDQYLERVIMPAEFLREIAYESIKNSSIVFVSSTQAFGGPIETGPYAAACAAQIRLALGLSKFLPSARVNVVCPGWTDTDMGKQVKETGGVSNPNATPQSPESVAKVIVDLIESDANGKVIRVVDGIASEAKWTW